VARILVAGNDTTPQDRQVLEGVQAAVAALGHEARVAAGDARQRPALLDQSDALVVVLDHLDPGSAWLAGIAKATRRPSVGIRTQPREAGVHDVVDLAIQVQDWSTESLRPQLQPFLARVRTFAGTLVRDAVPKLLEAEGKVLSFRNVAPPEYPAVLKRKLVDTARRLEETDFGAEQEEIADVLELLETLINLRKYDRESLRSIKEGKWRKRGGFERGFLLQEEPLAQSR